MKRAAILLLMTAMSLGAPALAKPAQPLATACLPAGEAACLLDAAWTSALLLPPEKLERVKPLFAPLALQLKDKAARASWDRRLGDVPVDMAEEDYVRRTAETAVREYGWEGFLQRAREGAAPLQMGRPEIMAAAAEFAPDSKQRARLIELMFALAGTPDGRQVSGISLDAFERADFGHVLAERMMRDCKLAGFDRAVALTAAPDALRYKLWRARITGNAGALAQDIRAGDAAGDTSHVRQALEGIAPLLSLGYCTK